MQAEETEAKTTWAGRRHERFTLLARGEEKLRVLVRGRQASDVASLARQGWTKLVGLVRSTTPSSLADHLREALGERPRATGPAEAGHHPVASPREDADRPRSGVPSEDHTADQLRMLRAVELGNPVFLEEGGDPCGAVREIHFGARPTLTVFIENAGDFAVPAGAVRAAHDGKVVLAADRLDTALRTAIARAHDAEQPGL